MRLNALTLLFGALIATGFPMRAERQVEAHPAASSSVTGALAQALPQLPDFVPVINFDQFLLAARQSDGDTREGATPAARVAAAVLSAKFALQAPADPDREYLHAVVQNDPVAKVFVEPPEDPKTLVQMAALESETMQSPRQKADFNVAAKAAEPSRTPYLSKREDRRSSRRIQLSRSAAKTSVVRRARHGRHRGQRRIADAQPQNGADSQSSGIGSYLAPLIGFRSLTPDRRLTTR